MCPNIVTFSCWQFWEYQISMQFSSQYPQHTFNLDDLVFADWNENKGGELEFLAISMTFWHLGLFGIFSDIHWDQYPSRQQLKLSDYRRNFQVNNTGGKFNLQMQVQSFTCRRCRNFWRRYIHGVP